MNRLTAGLVLAAAALVAPQAMAQLAKTSGPIDISANELELVDAQHLAIWRGDVDAIQGQDRLRSDVLNVYFTGKPSDGAQGSGAGQSPNGAQTSNAAAPGRDWGKVDHMVAEGHVFFVTPTQTARGDHGVYDLASDTVTVTGDVIVVQGQSVIHGEKLFIEVKSGHATMVPAGPPSPQRVRGVFYPNQNNTAEGDSAAPAKQP